MGTVARRLDWRALLPNVVMWTVAVYVCWMQVAEWDMLESRVIAFFGMLFVVLVWSVAGLLKVPLKKTWLHMLGSVALLASVLFFNLPMSASFAAYRGTMDQLADRLERGEEFNAAFRVGPHVFQKGEMWGPMACFWTTATMGDKDGFCRLYSGNPADHINEWSISNLGGGWYYIIED